MNNPFVGVGTALVTPFKKDFSIDFDGLKKLVDYQIDNGVNFLVVQGTTGESPTLSWSEKMEVLRAVQNANQGRVKIVFGVGGNNTADVIEKIQQLPSGVDGILSVSPYYNKPLQSGIVAHFNEVAKSTKLPIILYNVPGRTSSNMTPETTLELAKIENIVAVKEASGNMGQIMEIVRRKPVGFGVLSGDDPIVVPLMSVGVEGVISVVSNAFPNKFSAMVKSAQMNEFSVAKDLHYELLNVTNLFFEEGNPGGVKASLCAQGLMNETMRLPLVEISEDLRTRIKHETSTILK